LNDNYILWLSYNSFANDMGEHQAIIIQ